jgi:hypothetical protein
MGEILPRAYASLCFAVARTTKARSKLPLRRARLADQEGRRPRQRRHAQGRHIMSEELGARSIFGSDRGEMMGAQDPRRKARSISRKNTLWGRKSEGGHNSLGSGAARCHPRRGPYCWHARWPSERRVSAWMAWLQMCAVRCNMHSVVFECQLHTIASMPKTSAISVRLADGVKAALERAAAEDHRPLASYVEKLLLEHLRANGYLAVEPTRAGRVAGGAAYAKGMANSAIDRALEHSSDSANVHRERRRALTEMPARPVVKERRGK